MPTTVQDITHYRRWLWITTGSGELLQVDGSLLTVRHHYQLGHAIVGIAAADGKLWLALGSP
jgi:hypothetical protein